MSFSNINNKREVNNQINTFTIRIDNSKARTIGNTVVNTFHLI